MMKSKTYSIGLTPFERPDVDLALALERAGFFPVLHIGRSEEEAKLALIQMQERAVSNFGVCFADSTLITITLPEKVNFVILPANVVAPHLSAMELVFQVINLDEAKLAIKKRPSGLIIKGNESGGAVGEKSTFILFQEIKKNCELPLWIQGGMGIHSSAALIAVGARGVIFDSQLSLFPEASTSKQVRDTCKTLDGTETRVIDNFRVLIRPNSPKLPEEATFRNIEPFLSSTDLEKGFLPVGQDIAFAYTYAQKYKNLPTFFLALQEAVQGHLQQVKSYDVISTNSAFAKELGIKYPIAQGPMTRVSDVPEFAAAVADSGGLPFIALSLLTGEKAKDLLVKTKTLLNGKTWGVGILGFVSPELRKEQLQYIQDVRPPVALIAGGRPSQARPLEKLGIKTFLHVPSTGLLDIFLKEGAQRFVFEGRECGGHVGPLSSLVLWEKQIDRLLDEEELNQVNVLFAGGIHDALSAAIISVMTAPLAAKGAKIGVLMGTAYLYTKEAIESGAIVKQFQDQALKHTDTVLVETGPGHVTRCLNTPFVDFFALEKRNLLLRHTDKNVIGHQLELLNVGRLRIAAKGIERQEADLVSVNEAKQLSEGMYMIGQVAALRDEVITIEKLHHEVASAFEKILRQASIPEVEKPKDKSLDVAIVGMACIYPGARNLEEYWSNVVLGKDSIIEVPDDRWNKNLYYDPNSSNGEKTLSKWGGFIPTMQFDPVEFGIPPQSLAAIDPAQLLSLLVAKEALADAGYDKREFDRENTSVIFGVDTGGSGLSNSYAFRALYPQLFGELPQELDEALPRLTEDSFPGILPNVIAGRIANRLDLGGRNCIIDAACASSLAAVDAACQDLVLGKSSMVLAGGADLHNNISDYLLFSSTKALSKKGKCFTFDAEADGITLGEGIAVVVLKRLEDAKRDGDRVYGVIKGIGASSDGKSLGLTAPRKLGQVRALERAYRQAGVAPAEVGLMEAHGTGTTVGDRTELSSMTDLLIRSGAIKNQTQLGSVKTQIGHTKCASGLAGLIKVALSVYHGVKPPTLNLKQPNKFYSQETSPFVFNKESAAWLSEKRVAGVSAFGFGGTNFHAVIERNVDSSSNDQSAIQSWPVELLVFRGDDLTEATGQLRLLQKLLKTHGQFTLKDIAYTLASGNKPVQVSIIANDLADLLSKVELALQHDYTKDIYRTQKLEGKVAFMFSGQGSQRVNMARDLFVLFPSMRNFLQEHAEYEKILFPDMVFNETSEKKQAQTLKDTRIAQPLLGIVDYAIATLLRQFGVEPDMVAGHSYGELPALCFARAFDEKHLIRLSERRANAIIDAIEGDQGAMLAVNCNEQELLEILMDSQGVYLANHNSPSQLVVSGTTNSIKEFAEKLKTLNKSYRQLEVSCAFHSPLLTRSQQYFYEELSIIDFKTPVIPVWSNTSAAAYPTDPEEIKRRLAEHLVKPVLFCEEVKNMYESGARVFIEVGPGKVLAQLVSNIVGKECSVLHTEQKGVGGINQILNTLVQYLATGREVNLEQLFKGRKAHFINIESSQNYQISSTTWNVNGHTALPAFGKLPAHGALPITQPLKIRQTETMSQSTESESNRTNVDMLMLEYLKSVNAMVQAQRDVILGYLGATNPGFSNGAAHPSTLEDQTIIQPKFNQEKKNRPTESIPKINTTQPILSSEKIHITLLEVVSEKTGYPSEMLGLDMDLEADLSIDSIKRVEIIGELKHRFGTLQGIESNEDVVVEKLASIKTLNGLIEWITENTGTRNVFHSTPASPHTPKVSLQPNFSKETIKNTLLEVVSEKTGYPAEMLGMDMDLEADLSIDSIKRVEIIGDLKSRFGTLQGVNGNEDEVVEKLASIKTLSGLVEWIAGNAKAPLHSESDQIFSESVINVISTDLSASSIKKTLLEIVSDKTGYPQEMLGMDMDLEADLSIDSIKRIEIIGELKSITGIFKGKNENEEEIVETLASIKTLNGLVNWITNSQEGTNGANVAEESENGYDKNESLPEEGDEDVYRVGFEFILSVPEKEDIEIIGNKKFAITQAGIYSDTLKNLLDEHNATSTLVSKEDNLEEYDGLIFVDIASGSENPTIIDLFSYVQKLNHKKVKWIYVVTDFKSELTNSNKAERLNRIQGYSGFINSLNKEWDATCRTINIECNAEPVEAAIIVLNELLYDDKITDVYYKSKQRYKVELKEAEFSEEQSHLQLNKDSVVLVLGGAQGITSDIVIRLSKEYPCHYVLVGRSANPVNGSIENLSSINKDDIRKSLLAKQKFSTPRELEEKAEEVYKANQIRNTVYALESTGSTVTYLSVDLRDKTAMEDLLDNLYKTHGRIDGVIHAVGFLDDKFFHKKTYESFQKVYTTKVTPLKVLADKLRPETKFLVLFSSIASVMGNKGQVDYAAANSVLDEYAWELGKKISGRVVAINWGPWKGKGMISEALEKDLLRRGVSSIPLAQGANAFVKELKYGTENQIIIMSHIDVKVAMQ